MKTLHLTLLIIIWTLSVSIAQKVNKETSPYNFEMIYEIPATPVKSQNRSGTCWTYASASFIESELLKAGKVEFDISFGGAFYAFCKASDLGVTLTAEDFRSLIDIGIRVKRAVMDSLPIHHPFEEDLSFLYGTIIIGESHDPLNHSRNVCIFADGEVDRCPTGTGVSARAALQYARGELGLNEPFAVESILGTIFSGEVTEAVQFGPYEAIIPKVTGTAHITGRSELLIDPADPLGYGFILR